MPHGWDSYLVKIEDRPASVFVNLDAPDASVIGRQPQLLFVRFALQESGDHGLPTDTEFHRLSSAEAAVEPLLDALGHYAGRVTHDRTRTLLVYVSDESPPLEELDDTLRRHGYPAEAWTEPDPEWTNYFEWLRPGPKELRAILDRRVIEQLATAGDQPHVPRDVEHFVYFSDQVSQGAFLTTIASAGFTRAEATEPNPGSFGVRVVTHHAVDFDTVSGVVRKILEMAQQVGGEYDGWGTTVQKG